MPQLGRQLTTQLCARTGNWTHNLLVYRMMLWSNHLARAKWIEVCFCFFLQWLCPPTTICSHKWFLNCGLKMLSHNFFFSARLSLRLFFPLNPHLLRSLLTTGILCWCLTQVIISRPDPSLVFYIHISITHRRLTTLNIQNETSHRPCLILFSLHFLSLQSKKKGHVWYGKVSLNAYSDQTPFFFVYFISSCQNYTILLNTYGQVFRQTLIIITWVDYKFPHWSPWVQFCQPPNLSSFILLNAFSKCYQIFISPV